MNCIIPFESKVSFKSPVKEICSISLEHEITKNDSELLGNFFISGTYKEHELSVNTSEFKFTIPFSVELANRVDNNTLEFSIDNFTYELDDNDLNVKIDYIINADDLLEERYDDPLDLIEEVKDEQIKGEVVAKESLNTDISNEDTKCNEINSEVLSAIKTDDDYITYHVHIVKESETVESIAMEYNIEKDDLLKINNITSISPKDKLLIPLKNE